MFENFRRRCSKAGLRLLLILLVIGVAAVPVLAQSVPAAILVIPAISVQAEIVKVPVTLPTWDVSQLGERVGNLEGTGGWPGLPGNFVLAGHSSLPGDKPGVFHALTSLRVGDEIDVFTPAGGYRYQVVATGMVENTDISVVLPSAETKLTLVTCDEPSYDARLGTYTRRFVVVAVPVG